jgi:hypothetical protein
VGLEAREAGAVELGWGPPADLGELALIWLQGLADVAGQGEPKADVHMPRCGRADGFGHREEERPVAERRVGYGSDAQLFDNLAVDGSERVLAGLDVAAGWQPQAGQTVIAQQDARGRAVDQQEIRHQVRRGGARLDPPEDVVGSGEPRQRLLAVLPGEVVGGLDACYQVGDRRLQGCRHTQLAGEGGAS